MNTEENTHTLMTGSAVRRGALQSIPSSSIESCARLNETVPLAACGHTKRPRSSRLANRHRPVAIEPEHLHDVAAAATKDEHVARQGLLFEYRLHLGAEPMEAAPHVGHPSRNPDPRPCRKRDHGRRLMSTMRTTAGSTLPSRLIRTSPGSSI